MAQFVPTFIWVYFQRVCTETPCILIKITQCHCVVTIFLQNRTTDFDETLHVALVCLSAGYGTSQDPLAINTDLKSVTSSELLDLAILMQKSHYFGIFQQYLF